MLLSLKRFGLNPETADLIQDMRLSSIRRTGKGAIRALNWRGITAGRDILLLTGMMIAIETGIMDIMDIMDIMAIVTATVPAETMIIGLV